jgi:BirA family biotin operon repressor/biotin-[acetyl-CoA-carboxylase] ligase
MNRIDAALVAALADGAVHSGAELAADLNCSRTAVWKHLSELRALGLAVEARRGSGYRLPRPLELLDEGAIRSALCARTRDSLARLEIQLSIPSTSEWLRQWPSPAPGRFDLVLAEHQSSGRGRRGRRWLSPFAGGLCLSLSWCFEPVPASLPALSLAVGVGVCRTLGNARSASVGLKWPNDIVAAGGKLGGLLVDVQGEAGGPLTVIVGLGLNFDTPADLSAAVLDSGGLPPVGLRQISTAPGLSRNRLAGALANEIHAVLTTFAVSGFAPFADEWRSHDRLAGQPVVVTAGRREFAGIARGIDADGALLLAADGKLSRHVAGEVSVRPGPAG